jgi:hypothetical protein
MRYSLVVAGGIITLTGVGLYAALDGYAWLALIAGGVVTLACGFVLEEVDERVEPPPGYHFCPFCSTPVAEGVERCSHCNGLQDWVARPNPAPPQPNH